jgi:hypothetical protein
MFGRKPKTDPIEMSRKLRKQALSVGPGELGLAPTEARQHVWGVLMELGYPQAVATLVVLGEGTTSLYISTGGGIIGAGEHPPVRAAAEKLLAVTEAHLDGFHAVAETPLPQTGRVRFYVRTFGGTLGAEADEQDLGHGRHKLSPVFHAGHAVITEMRLASEDQQRAK